LKILTGRGRSFSAGESEPEEGGEAGAGHDVGIKN